MDSTRETWRLANLGCASPSDEERASKLRLAEMAAEARHLERAKQADHERDQKAKAVERQHKSDSRLYYTLCAMTATVGPACIYVLLDTSRPPERTAWASPLLTLLVGGFVGFATGRLQGKPPSP